MSTSVPACLLYTRDDALARRLAAYLHALDMPVQAEPDAATVERRARAEREALVFVDLRTDGATPLLTRLREDSPSVLAVALGHPRSDPMLEAEAFGVHAVEDLQSDDHRIQALTRQAVTHLRLLRDNRMLRERAASAPAPAAPRPEPEAAAQRLAGLTRAFRHFTDVDTLLDHVVEGIAATALVGRVGLFARGADARAFTLRAGLRCLPETREWRVPERDRFAQWLEAHAHLVAGGTLEHVQDLADRDMLRRALVRLGAEVVIPLHARGRLAGWLFVGGRATGVPFTHADLEDLAAMADQVSTVIDNALLHNEVVVQKTLAETLLHTIPTGIVAVDTEGVIRGFNEAAEAILETAAASVIGRPAETLGTRLSDALRRALLADPPPAAAEWQDATTRRHLSVQTRRLGGARTLGAVALVHDLSAEREIRRQQEKVERDAFWTQLAASMSHEIRNPLVAISTFAQLLPERYADPDFRDEFSRIVKHEVDRLNTIIEQINSFAHPPRLHFRGIDARRIARKAVQLATARLGSDSAIQFVVDIPDDTPAVRGDEHALTDGLGHLLANAIDAVSGAAAPRIAIAARPQAAREGDGPTRIALSVSDNGSGIPDPIRDSIFSPFCTTKMKGMGLGLPIVQRTVTDHGGEIQVQTGAGGTTITMVLPAAPEEAPDEAHADRG